MIAARRPVLLCLLGALVTWGCDRPPAPPPKPRLARQTLRIGLIPEQNLFRQLERYEPLADYLDRKTGVGFEVKVLPRYGSVVDNFTRARLDGAFFGSFAYVLAQTRLDVSVLARPVNLDGSSTYHGLIFVRRDSGIETVAQMRAKRFVFVDPVTMAGYLLPLDYFRSNGVTDYESYLREVYFSGTHEDAFYDVLNRKADIGAAKNTVLARLSIVDKVLAAELAVVARSPDVPENALALKNDIDPALRQRLREVLLSMDREPEGRRVLEGFQALRFVETVDEDYEPVVRYMDRLGLDPATYDARVGR